MPTAQKLTVVFTESEDNYPGVNGREKALEAMRLQGVVDESTLVLSDVSRDCTLNLGPDEDGEPILVNVREYGLVAERWTAEAVPHEGLL